MILFIDFETYSEADLKKVGAYRYAADPTTRPLMMGWAFEDDTTPSLWMNEWTLPQIITDHVSNGGLVAAWNIEFDRQIWNKRFPAMQLDTAQCVDVMAMAAAMGLPLGLDAFCRAVEIPGKHANGKRLIQKFCSPPIVEHAGPDWNALKAYARMDVSVLRHAYTRLNKLSAKEMRYHQIDMRINDTGIPLDIPSVTLAAEREIELSRAQEVGMKMLTGLKPTQTVKLAEWINQQEGVLCTSLAKDQVAEMLTKPDLPKKVRDVLELRQLAAKSSTAKLRKMLGVNIDGRAHGCLCYHAATTGRAGGRLIQTQNLPRPELDTSDIEAVLDNGFKGATLSDISSCIRALICADRLVCSDWSNIEGRVLAWLAGEDWKLDAFEAFDAGTGPDIYKLAASKIYDIEVDEISKKGRQVGKTAELACGYQGGLNAFRSMATVFNVAISDTKALEAVKRWRDSHPKVKRMWYRLEETAKRAIQMPGTTFGRFVLEDDGNLYMTLPSGRRLCYPFARMKLAEYAGKHRSVVCFWGRGTYTRNWQELSTYSGKLTENLVQATARDILYEALDRLERQGHSVVMHVHDEVLIESDTLTVEELNREMCVLPDWAGGLPLAAEGWAGARYRK